MAIVVGCGLGALVLGAVSVRRVILVAVVAVAAGIGVVETGRALRATGIRPPLVPVLAGTVIVPAAAWRNGVVGLMLAVVVTVGGAAVWRLCRRTALYRQDLAAAALLAVYIPVLLSFGVLLVRPDDGAVRVLVTVSAVVLSDTGGYLVGAFLGKHSMAPRISPKKSWEGFAGSLLAAALGSALALRLAWETALYLGAVFGVAIALVAVLGDLTESVIKRRLGIKDMSHLLPGHGGLMDRLDSLLFALPTAFFLLSYIARPQ